MSSTSIKRGLTLNPAIFAHVMIFLSPFGLYAISLGGGVELALMNIYQIVLLPIFLIICLMRNRVPSLTPVGQLYLLFILVSLVGCIVAENQMAAVRGTGAYAVKYFLAFLFTIYFLRTRKDVETAAKLFVVMGLVSAVMGFTQLVGYWVFGKIMHPPFAEYFSGANLSMKAYGYETGAYSIPGFMKMYGFFNAGAQQFGSYMLVPFGLSLYIYHRSKSVFRFLLIILFFFVILLSVSRNAYVGLMALVLVFFIFHKALRLRYYPLAIKPILIIFLFISLWGFLYTTRDAKLFELSSVKVNEQVSFNTPISLIERLNPYASRGFQKSIGYFTEHAGYAVKYGFQNLGFGLGTQNFDDHVWQQETVLSGYSAHSNFLIFLGDNGIWGLAVQVLIVILTVSYGLRAYFRNDRDLLPLCLTAVFLGLVFTGIIRTFYTVSWSFIVMGMITRLYLLSRESGQLASEKNECS